MSPSQRCMSAMVTGDLPPAQSETRAVPVGGPRHYAVKTCAERGFHVVRKIESAFPTVAKCQHCGETGNQSWARHQLSREGDFLLELGTAVEDLAKRQIREHRTIFDSQDEELNKAAERAGGK